MLSPTRTAGGTLVEKYGITILYTAPTAIRGLMRFGEAWPATPRPGQPAPAGHGRRADQPRSLDAGIARSPADRCPIMDTWWQTETGGIHDLRPRPSCRSSPAAARALCRHRGRCGDARKACRWTSTTAASWSSASPGRRMMRTIYGTPSATRPTGAPSAGVYFAGDARRTRTPTATSGCRARGRRDQGQRPPPGQQWKSRVEPGQPPGVAEAAAIGLPDELTGEHIKVYVIIRNAAIERQPTR